MAQGHLEYDSIKELSAQAKREGKRLRAYDDKEEGLSCVCHPSGRVTFALDYGPPWRRRRVTLGVWDAMSASVARELAKDKKREIRKGADPVDEKRARRDAPTWSSWVAHYLEGVKLRKKTWQQDQYYLKGYEGHDSEAMDAWRRRKLEDISYKDVEHLFREVSQRGKTTGNRWLASVRACFSEAVRQEFITENPAMKVQLAPENPPRTRVLSSAEEKKLIEAVLAIKDKPIRTLFVLLLNTGCRLSEALRARWEDVDLKNRVWRIPSPKAGEPQVVPLGEAEAAMLSELTTSKSGWVFPSPRKPDYHRTTVRKEWAALTETLEAPDLNIHDLRRSFGLRVAKNNGILAASKALRHSDPRITAKVYAPYGVDDLRDATEVGKIVPFPAPRRARKSG